MNQSPLGCYLLDTPDLLIDETFIWRSEFSGSIYDKGILYVFCCAIAKLYKKISAFGLTKKLSARAQNFDPEKLVVDLKLPTCFQDSLSVDEHKGNFLVSILSELLCDAIDLRDKATHEQNSLQNDRLSGQYFGHYSVITTMMNEVVSFKLFDMLPDSWRAFDPDTLHNDVSKSELGL